METTTLQLRYSLAVLLAVGFLAAGCTAEIVGSSSHGKQDASSATPSGGVTTTPGDTTTPPVMVDGTTVQFSPAAGSFKRLTTSELKNSLNALLGPITLGEVEPDTFVNGFAKVGGSTVSISLNGVQQYQVAIEAATAAAFADKARASALLG